MYGEYCVDFTGNMTLSLKPFTESSLEPSLYLNSLWFEEITICFWGPDLLNMVSLDIVG